MRLVVASRYDSGSTFLPSYYVILEEMLDNGMPRRIIRQCLLRALKYTLGRRSCSKSSWCRVLSKQVFNLKIGEGFEAFRNHLVVLVKEYKYHPSLFDFKNDTTPYAATSRARTVYHVPGRPLVRVVYRGPRSRKLYLHLRRKYTQCTAVYCHDRYYGSRHLCHKGAQRIPASIRKAKLLAQ